MGCSSEAVFEEWKGQGLRKENPSGKPIGSAKGEMSQIKWGTRFMSVFGGRFMTREMVPEMRKGAAEHYVGRDGNGGINGPKSPWKKWMDQCDFNKFTIPGPPGFESIDVFEVRTKANKDSTDLVPIVHFHGGAGIMSDPEYDNFWCARWAVENPCVMFSCRYRLAPEAQFGTGHLDASYSVKYFIENAQNHGCDPSKLVVQGESGGGWVALGSMIVLMREDHEILKKIKLLHLQCPMLGWAIANKY